MKELLERRIEALEGKDIDVFTETIDRSSKEPLSLLGGSLLFVRTGGKLNDFYEKRAMVSFSTAA